MASKILLAVSNPGLAGGPAVAGQLWRDNRLLARRPVATSGILRLMDPTTELSLALHDAPGVYAVLLRVRCQP